jgi:predicted Co/Zn/Cd cation transporter (cation efflux family)
MNAPSVPKKPLFDLREEGGILRLSIATTLIVSALGIGFGLASGSFSILFDGVYSLIDAVMTILSLAVIRLITLSATSSNHPAKLHERFSMGLWHLEPMVLGLNGLLATIVAIYALFNAIISLMNGGRELEFGWAMIYAAVTFLAYLSSATIGYRANKKVDSDFVRLDILGWAMSGGITLALLVAFIIGWAVDGTSYAYISPYIDPAVLAIICFILIPLPLRTIKQAFSDILMVTPSDMKQRVDTAASQFAATHGFITHRAYIARVGRARQIEIYFIVPENAPPQPIAHWDKLRDEFGELIGDEGPNRWLTILFTSDMEWAE